MPGILIALSLVILAGVAIAVQAPINGALGRTAGDGVFAATVSFLVGTLALIAFMLARGGLPQLATLRAIPFWMWTGGVLGAFYVWAALTNIQTLGALTLTAALILGQLVAALLLDATGAFGLESQAVSWQRLAAMALVGGGLILSRL